MYPIIDFRPGVWRGVRALVLGLLVCVACAALTAARAQPAPAAAAPAPFGLFPSVAAPGDPVWLTGSSGRAETGNAAHGDVHAHLTGAGLRQGARLPVQDVGAAEVVDDDGLARGFRAHALQWTRKTAPDVGAVLSVRCACERRPATGLGLSRTW